MLRLPCLPQAALADAQVAPTRVLTNAEVEDFVLHDELLVLGLPASPPTTTFRQAQRNDAKMSQMRIWCVHTLLPSSSSRKA